MAAIGYEMFGFAASILGTVFLVIPLVYALLTGGMPSARMRTLDVLLSETETLLRTALQEGTIDYEDYEVMFQEGIWNTKTEVDQLRAVVYSISNWWDELKLWLFGLSRQIGCTTSDLNALRRDIALSSSHGRNQLGRMGCTTNPTLVIYAKEPIRNLVLPVAPPNAANMPQSHVAGAAVLATKLPEHSQVNFTRFQRPHTAVQSNDATEHTGPAEPLQANKAIPPLVFRSDTPARSQRVENRRATRNTLLDFGRKLVHYRDECHGTSPVPILPLKQQNTHTGRFGALTSLFRGADMMLPRHTSDFATQTTAEKASGDAVDWMEKGHVVFQVQLPIR